MLNEENKSKLNSDNEDDFLKENKIITDFNQNKNNTSKDNKTKIEETEEKSKEDEILRIKKNYNGEKTITIK